MAPDSFEPTRHDSETLPTTPLTRRSFARRIAELAGGAAFAAIAGGHSRVALAAQRGAAVAHTYCVPGEVLAVLRHPGALTRC